MTKKDDPENCIQFGQHKDLRFDEVPARYLLWCWEQKTMALTQPHLCAYIQANLRALEVEARMDDEAEENDSWGDR